MEICFSDKVAGFVILREDKSILLDFIEFVVLLKFFNVYSAAIVF